MPSPSLTSDNVGEEGSTKKKSYQLSNKRVVVTPSWARTLPKDEVEYLYDYSAPLPAGLKSSTSKSSQLNRNRSLSSVVRQPTSDETLKSSYNNKSDNKPSTSNNKADEIDQNQSTVIDIPSGSGTKSWQHRSSDERPPSSIASSSSPLTKPRKAHSNSDLRREGEASSSVARDNPSITHNASNVLTDGHGPEAVSAPPTGDRWWTFTLPSKYLDRVHEYVGKLEQRDNENGLPATTGVNKEKEKAEEKASSAQHEKQGYARSMSMSMAARLAPSNVFSLNQTQTPGWSTPWQPFHRDEESVNANRDPFSLVQAATAQQTKTTRFENFILHNVFAPLVFRSINLVLAACTLGIAAHIRMQEHNNRVIGIIGSSTLFVIIVSPFSIVHIFATVYIEYFGPPIGIWNVRTKMAYTLLELVFICLWSAILSLAFDDLFTSSLECTAFTPYARYNSPPASVGASDVEGTIADSICSQQIAQVVFIFLSVLLYISVLVVSLLRIFVRVSRKA